MIETHTDPILGESVVTGVTSSGLRVRVVPTQRFQETVAALTVGYGSTDLDYVLDGTRYRSPEGVAHYLEHKLFEAEDLHVFERFGRRGARVNAMTSFTRTTYYFHATDQVEANLRDLLELVSTPHLTPENVEKERGIIAQELKMYEDSPEYRGFFGLLQALYRHHPVRHPVGGTIESIGEIDVDELLRCHRAFYRTGNAALAIAGPVDAEAMIELAEAASLPAGAAVEMTAPEDPLAGPPELPDDIVMGLARPRLLIGFRDEAPIVEPDARMRRDLATRVTLDRLLGPSSDVRESLHRRRIVDDTLTSTYMSERSFGFGAIVCEADDPESVRDELLRTLDDRPAITPEDFDRAKRKMLGQWVRSFDSQRSLAFAHVEECLDGLAPFSGLQRMQDLELGDVQNRADEMFRADARSAITVR